ncbi:MAG: peptidoglycan glycosyltransferase [Lachnospiraceae bacterium]|nr:peptidoglycan glycosyltransferase [Lachnospiraceae bacterium]
MLRRREQRKQRKFTKQMQTRLLICGLMMFSAFIFLIYRVVEINETNGQRYAKKTLSQRTYVSNPIIYKRGDILDRNNTKLATSVRVYNVILAPKTILEKSEYRQATINALTMYFGVEAQEINEILNNKPESEYTILLKGVSKEKVDAYEEMLADEKERCKKANETCKIVGVWFEKNYKRTYPLEAVACNVIGVANSENKGSFGLELQYNNKLNGKDGREYGYYNENSVLERTVKAAENGNSIVTTLDANIQKKVEKRIKNFMSKTGASKVAALVMNPQNGEIYAMASDTSFDLNNAFDLSYAHSKEEINGMTDEARSENLSKMWENFCVSFSYEPGSTFKPLTVAAALEENLVTANNTFVCDGGEKIVDTPIACVSTIGHGYITLEESLMKSCNDVMMQIAEKMGRKTFRKYQRVFNMGRKTGIDLPGETTGVIHPLDKLNATELATSSFGQSFNVNMVQIASAISSVINGGYYYQPHVVKAIVDEDGNEVEEMEPVLVRKTVSEQTSAYIRKYMQATVEEGTASSAHINGYSIGGKTGTAEKYPRKSGNYLVSFIGAAPMENPEVVVYVIVDEPRVEDQAHSVYAQEVARGIMKDIFPFLGIYPDESKIKKENEDETEVTPEPRVTVAPEPTADANSFRGDIPPTEAPMTEDSELWKETLE